MADRILARAATISPRETRRPLAESFLQHRLAFSVTQTLLFLAGLLAGALKFMGLDLILDNPAAWLDFFLFPARIP